MYGDKDPDGFYWGELRGRRGYVPHNMVTEIDENQVVGGSAVPGAVGALGGSNSTTTGQPLQQSVRGVSRDRWGDIYANMPVKRMVALYDYDPQELSPNVDAEVSPYINYGCPITSECVNVKKSWARNHKERGFGLLIAVRSLCTSFFRQKHLPNTPFPRPGSRRNSWNVRESCHNNEQTTANNNHLVQVV